MDTVPAHADKKRRSKAFIAIVIVLIALVVGLGVTSVILYRKYQDVKQNPDAAVQENAQALTDKVAKLITLPDETPTIAVVQDKEKLKDQAFFKDAENGDKVLIFTAAKQAIIYRESEDKLVNVGPISLEESDVEQDDKADDGAASTDQ